MPQSFRFTLNQGTDMVGGFTPTTTFTPNRIMGTNQAGYAYTTDLTVQDIENLAGFVFNQFDNIASLRSFASLPAILTMKSANVLGYYTRGDGGGSDFVWDSASTEADNGISVIQVTGITTGRWKRIWDGGPINCRVAGCKGDGVTDDSSRFQALINLYAPNTVATETGVSIMIPAGKFILGDINVPSGVQIFSPQTAKYIYIPTLRCIVYPKAGAEYVFYFMDNCINSELEGVYVDGDFSNNPNLKAAVRLSFNACNLRRCLFNRCAQHAVIVKCGNMFIEECGIFGWYGPAPAFTSLTDFRGALHIEQMGDGYILNNEIGAGLPYFDTYPNPLDMLRDPVNRRICSTAFVGGCYTSVISGNLFENGDCGVAIANFGGLYNTFHHNRYELSGGVGLRVDQSVGLGGGLTFFTFAHERFSDNSLAGNGVWSDIDLPPGTCGYWAIDSPIFEQLYSPAIPTSNFKVKWNINNKASTEINLSTPQSDPVYTLNGLVNNVDVDALPVRQVKGQYDPDRPIFQKITITGPITEAQKGYVTISPGTNAGAGGYPGSVEFYDAANNLVVQQGFSPADVNGYFAFKMIAPLFWLFSNASALFAKTGECQMQIQSSDGTGDTVIRMIGDFLGTKITQFRQDKTTGNLTITCGGDVNIGVADNIKFLNSGQNALPNLPVDSVSGYHILSRNTATGAIEKVPTTSVFTLRTGTPSVAANGSITATAGIVGNDSRGKVQINVTAGTLAAGAVIATVTFSAAYPSTPGVVVCGASTAGATSAPFVFNETTTGFDICVGNGVPAIGGYDYNYVVIS